MAKIYQLIGCWVLFFSVTACETETTIDIDFPRPLAVMNAILHPDSVIRVQVSSSFNSTLENPDIEQAGGLEKFMIEDAQVELFVNGVSKGIMQQGEKRGWYDMPGVYPTAGDQVSMQVVTDSYPELKAATPIPSPVRILSVDTLMVPYNYNYTDNGGMKTFIRFKDEPGKTNYYCLRFMWMSEFVYEDTGESYYYSVRGPIIHTGEEPVLEDALFPGTDFLLTSYYSTYTDNWRVYVFDDYLFEGEEYTLKVLLSVPRNDHSGLPDATELWIDLFTISESAYLYSRSKILQDKQKDILGNNGLREPIPTYTNVQGGYGLLSAQQQFDRYIIQLPAE
ncbi:MAG: DUF4249 domain-containing protein [Tannerellaceae bacterium]|nr:DUF4249 domain-containing protein [Tannerellaceae bacterium]